MLSSLLSWVFPSIRPVGGNTPATSSGSGTTVQNVGFLGGLGQSLGTGVVVLLVVGLVIFLVTRAFK